MEREGGIQNEKKEFNKLEKIFFRAFGKIWNTSC